MIDFLNYLQLDEDDKKDLKKGAGITKGSKTDSQKTPQTKSGKNKPKSGSGKKGKKASKKLRIIPQVNMG